MNVTLFGYNNDFWKIKKNTGFENIMLDSRTVSIN